MRTFFVVSFLALCTTLAACGSDSAGAADPDAQSGVDAQVVVIDGGPDAAPDCLQEGHAVGDHFPAADGCNFCDCNADGSRTCTTRPCAQAQFSCQYQGVTHAYGEIFPSSDPCNDCTCAASGLACTRRVCEGALEEGAILLERLTDPCGPFPEFTAAQVLSTMPFDEMTAPFSYERERELYPEVLPDTNVTFRVGYFGGTIVCRIPHEGQEALDIEVSLEMITDDGAFDEGFHAYLRRNRTGFTNAWYMATSLPAVGLNGTYDPDCFDFNGYGFGAEINFDETGGGAVTKTCESDIGLTVGSWSVP